MAEVVVNVLHHEYTIFIENGLLARLSEYVRPYTGKRAVIVTDDRVAPYYLSRVKEQMEKGGVACGEVVIPHGEGSKSSAMLQRLYDAFFEYQLTRSDVIVALGGGVIGDLTGYAAATFLRGLPFLQIPTTLLAQVDSSVGGKVAINVAQGKNLIGTFYQPDRVLADLDVLKTLDHRQKMAGLAEVFKYGCIADANLLQTLREHADHLEDVLGNVVADCCRIKAHYVENDPYDKGIRMELNFGHTLGHAVEKICGYGAYLHGEAVAIGMPAAAYWGELLGITPKGLAEEIRQREQELGMPTRLPDISLDEAMRVMAGDKKSAGDDIHIVLLKERGKAVAHRIHKAELKNVLEEAWPWMQA